MVYVAGTVQDAFLKNCAYRGKNCVLYNTNESEKILEKASENAELPGKGLRWCGVGKVTENKGFDRMIRIQERLQRDGISAQLCILGDGPQRAELEALARKCGVDHCVTSVCFQM